eukprot:TRINITY_DN7427_c0_g1_i3.p1 TRINITY_DN7427_c0_g1~~TRINITY_DN7427_c0_g1_i3.p1  ORF type:complete len:181 (+),score=34.19 TRINITY_DN7427_c0_g1_i3:29-571(+)
MFSYTFYSFYFFIFFFFSSRRRHTRSCLVSWARRCVQETGNNNAPSNEENVKTNPVQATIANAKTEEIFPKYHATLKTTNQRMAVLTKKVKLFQIQQLNENERRGNNYDVKLTRYQDQKGEQFVNQDNLSNSLEKKVKSQATCHQGANVVQIRDPNNYLVQYSPKYSQKMAQIAQIYIKK